MVLECETVSGFPRVLEIEELSKLFNTLELGGLIGKVEGHKRQLRADESTRLEGEHLGRSQGSGC